MTVSKGLSSNRCLWQITMTEVRGLERQKGHKELYRGGRIYKSLLPKIKIELVVPDDLG